MLVFNLVCKHMDRCLLAGDTMSWRSSKALGLVSFTQLIISYVFVVFLLSVACHHTTGLSTPKGIRFSDVTDTSATVHWTAPRTRVDRFQVTYVPAQEGEDLKPAENPVGAPPMGDPLPREVHREMQSKDTSAKVHVYSRPVCSSVWMFCLH